METYKNVSQDIRSQLDAEAEVVKIILIGIDNDIYACRLMLVQNDELGKFTSRDGETLESYYSRFYKMMNELFRNKLSRVKTVSSYKLYDILKQHQNEVNEIRAEGLARTANPLALCYAQGWHVAFIGFNVNILHRGIWGIDKKGSSDKNLKSGEKADANRYHIRENAIVVKLEESWNPVRSCCYNDNLALLLALEAVGKLESSSTDCGTLRRLEAFVASPIGCEGSDVGIA
ncbi:hypothetical protein Tco_0344399 [Tanacetum coccineum]